MTFTIHRIPAFTDNYLWVVSNDRGEALVVDPGDSAPVVAFLHRSDLALAAIVVTHHHPDHVGGIPDLLARYDCTVYGPASPRLAQVSQTVTEGNKIEIIGASFMVLETPGHTLDHVVYYSEDLASAPVLFSGDTLFAAGCGRLFEGSPQQMQASLAKIATLPRNTLIYCAHEYTLANLRFAAAVEPANPDIAQRLAEATAIREKNLPTIPTNLAVEFCTNPFLRYDRPDVTKAASEKLGRPSQSVVETFASIRSWKDNF